MLSSADTGSLFLTDICQTIFDGTRFLYRSLKVGRARPFSNAGHERKDEVERHII